MDFTEEHKALFGSLMALIRSTNSLNAQDIDFIRNLNRSFGERSTAASEKLLGLINKLMNTSQSSKGHKEVPFSSYNDLMNRWRSVEDTIELLLDKMDSPPEKHTETKPAAETRGGEEYMKLMNNISKPQLGFNTKVDNSVGPFKPLLTQKPHATFTSLSESLAIQPPDEEHEREWYQQPYLQEILHSKCTVSEGKDEFPDWDSTPLTIVDTLESLFKMVSKLEKADVIAVDVEHHDFRSYMGLVCLLQISANGEDFIVDALKLRSELQVLNKVFTDPKIVKVFHGAKMDIMWLQRDLGVYVVNLFDTYFAAQELLFPKLSLAYLLQTFTSFSAQKKYQLADWRVRPLPQTLIDYARADTHFLSYIYHQLYRKLVEKNRLDAVLEESKKVAAERYENPGWNTDQPEWAKFALKHGIQGHVGRAVLIKLLEWRDETAREYDESPRFVMSPSFVANLCFSKPNNAAGVLSAATNKPSHIVRKKAGEIAEVIQNACNNADNIDTEIPESVYRRSRSRNFIGNDPNETDDHSRGSSSDINIESLHIKSQLLFDAPKTGSDRVNKSVSMSILLPEDVARAQEINKQAAEVQAREKLKMEQEEERRRAQEKEAAENAAKRAEKSSSKRSTGHSGKKLKIMKDSDDVSLSIKPAKQAKKHKDEPAFDFNSASEILSNKNDEPLSSFSNKFPANSKKKGARRSNGSKKARSFR